MAIAFDAAVAFDSPTYSFDGVTVGPVPAPVGSSWPVNAAPYRKKKKKKKPPVLILEPALVEFRDPTDEELILLFM